MTFKQIRHFSHLFLPIISEDSLETREKINHNKLSTQLMRVSEAKIQLSVPQELENLLGMKIYHTDDDWQSFLKYIKQ